MDSSQAGLAVRLRERRRELGLSQQGLAGAEMSARYVSLLESGKRVPTASILAVLAQRLATTPAYLRDGVDERVLLERRLGLSLAELAVLQQEPTDALTELGRAHGWLDADDPLFALA